MNKSEKVIPLWGFDSIGGGDAQKQMTKSPSETDETTNRPAGKVRAESFQTRSGNSKNLETHTIILGSH